MHGIRRQSERIPVPFEDREIRAKDRKHRVTAPAIGEFHPVPAELRRGAEVVLAPPCACHQLRAKADAQNRLVGLAHAPHEPGKIGKVWVGIVGQRVLFSAEDHQRVVIGTVRQGLARPGAKDLDFGVRLPKGHTDLAQGRHFRILDDRDAHACPSPHPRAD